LIKLGYQSIWEYYLRLSRSRWTSCR